MKLYKSLPDSFPVYAACFLLALLSVFRSSGQVFVGGDILVNTTYSKANNPYIVVQNLTVSPGITLTIEPGTELRFSSNTSLTVKGVLVAQGTAADSIRLILSEQIPNQSLWNGLVFDNAHTLLDSQGNYISGTVVSYASFFNSNYSITLAGLSGILVEHCLLRRSAYGIYINNAEYNLVRNCRITQTGYGVFIPSGFSARFNTFSDNDISGNFSIGFLINNGNSRIQHNTITGNRFSSNYIGLYIGNDGLLDKGYNEITSNIINTNTLEGIRIYQDSTFFSKNLVIGNGTGLNLHHSKWTEVNSNVFSGNTNWACLVSDSSSLNIFENNSISLNGGGIKITSEGDQQALNNSFLHNSLYSNDSSFLIQSAPQGAVHYNNIYDNGILNSFLNYSRGLIHAENNWWGTPSEPQIDSIIFDQLDKPDLGLVQYKTPLLNSDPQAPIMAPRNVVKRQVGQDVLVTWDPVVVSDLKGYNVYYGKFNGFSFASRLEAGNTNSLLLPHKSVFDSVAASAVDMEADGILDFTEGHESAFVFALLSPYAGPDTTICINTPLYLDKSTAYNYESIYWTTSGDGTFMGAHSIHPTYTPGLQDYAQQQVTLTVLVSGTGFSLSDQVNIHFRQYPVVNAGNDTLISDTVFITSRAQAENISRLRWLTSGDGYFLNDTLLIATYIPGTADKSLGSVVLTLNTESVCGEVVKMFTLGIQQSFSLSGKVHAGSQLAQGSVLSLFSILDGKVKPMRSTLTSPDGLFTFGRVGKGNYYIHVVPDKFLSPGYAPTYYYSNLHWADAYNLPVNLDTYDLDVNLIRLPQTLPQGEGFISGNCYAPVGGGENCGNIAVFLYDKTGKYLLDWAWVSGDGLFSLSSLPFGEYLLIGEKAGYARFFSEVISLTPSQPQLTNVILQIESAKISFILPSSTTPPLPAISIYPNPANDWLYFENLPHEGKYSVKLISSCGKIFHQMVTEKTGSAAALNISFLPAGLYLLDIRDGDLSLQKLKLIKY